MNIAIIFCRDCGKEFRIHVFSDDLAKWRNGMSIQNAMPYLDAATRELFISQTCGDCWDKMFAFDIWEDEIASS